MLTDDRRTMLEILAAVEVLFTPHRFERDRRAGGPACVIQDRRESYLAGKGLPWRIGGDNSSRQDGHQQLQRLQRAGFIEIHRGGTDRRVGVEIVRLDELLSLTPTETTNQAWPRLKRLNKLDRDPDVLRNCDFILEHDVIGIDRDYCGGSPEATSWQFGCIPLLIRGWVESYSDACGTLGWRITGAGREALNGRRPRGVAFGTWNDEQADWYGALVETGLQERARWQGESNSVTLPLSAGLWMTSGEWDEYRAEQAARSTALEETLATMGGGDDGD